LYNTSNNSLNHPSPSTKALLNQRSNVMKKVTAIALIALCLLASNLAFASSSKVDGKGQSTSSDYNKRPRFQR
jgi:hypothetical protein